MTTSTIEIAQTQSPWQSQQPQSQHQPTNNPNNHKQGIRGSQSNLPRVYWLNLIIAITNSVNQPRFALHVDTHKRGGVCTIELDKSAECNQITYFMIAEQAVLLHNTIQEYKSIFQAKINTLAVAKCWRECWHTKKRKLIWLKYDYPIITAWEHMTIINSACLPKLKHCFHVFLWCACQF